MQKNKNFEDYTCVIISTLNQMVNYIPLKYFDFKEVYNLTIEDSEYADNSKWDNNIKEFFPNIENIPFKQSQISNINAIQRKLNKFKNKKVFWNITGGQKPFILAINLIAKKDDVICYLEGNKNRMVILENNRYKKGLQNYSLDDLNIEIALKLMGFEIKETKTSHRNLVQKCNEKNDEKSEEEENFYLEFLDEYIAIKDKDKRKILLKNFLNLNKNYPKTNPKNTFDNRLKTYKENRKSSKDSIKNILNNLNSDKLEEELEQKPKEEKNDKKKNVKAFGFILEKLAGYKILNLAKDKIADITFGEKINYLKDKVDEYHIDEFDIALLTKNGKFMIFECKSGGMDGDVAKSTKYSTYAISGAYGLPILITPLLQDEIDSIDSLDKEIYGYIQSAVKSAKRAGLEVWGLDEIEDRLKKYIEI